MPKILRLCRRCQRPFHVWPYLIQQGYGVFCSSWCHAISMMKGTFQACLHCGKSFHVKESRQKKGQVCYCSRRCMGQARTLPVKQRLLDNIVPCQHMQPCPYCCFVWKLSKNNGYGQIRLRGTSARVHRLAWEQWHGRPIPPGLEACHDCHCKSCCNPLHIFIGTHQENMQDSLRDGQISLGSKRRGTKLTETDIPHIFHRYRTGTRIAVIAADYGVARATINSALARKTWKHVPIP